MIAAAERIGAEGHEERRLLADVREAGEALVAELSDHPASERVVLAGLRPALGRDL